ncbi:hypothetical protein E2C01_021646 [Portunus trituberculatus]|uniref:Uncharacterized protein n=1 Tax=Portunus trituberculatus TaxID=210409 RepID=A0A5B7E395_PORTR|nr:hypothetical protein [Portunus trituberculatus]
MLWQGSAHFHLKCTETRVNCALVHHLLGTVGNGDTYFHIDLCTVLQEKTSSGQLAVVTRPHQGGEPMAVHLIHFNICKTRALKVN